MTYEQTREQFLLAWNSNAYIGMCTSDDMRNVIEALDRQIPKLVSVKQWSTARCPTCGMELSESLGDGYYKHPTFLKVCPNEECCQKLKWE